MADCNRETVERSETVTIEAESLDTTSIRYQDNFAAAKYELVRQAERQQAVARDLRRLAALEDDRAADIYRQINAGFPVTDPLPNEGGPTFR